MEDILLPLFPLEVVLLPGEVLPLHIFEERYKEMIGECLATEASGRGQSEFGIVLAKDREICNIGCAAQIIRVTRRYADGRMDIVTAGQRRFEILFTDAERSYLRAGVEFFEDEPSASPPPGKDIRRALELFEQVMKRVSNRRDPAPPHEIDSHLSFRMAALLPLDLELKQKLLTLRNEAKRLQELSRALEEMIPQIDRAARVHEKAGSNGDLRQHR
jgi:Lon protease-like protein